MNYYIPNCPKCESKLIEFELGYDGDQTKPALACDNVDCDFIVSDTLNEFLFDG